MTSAPGLAIFDLDYTLTRRGTWGRFVWQNVRFRPHIWLPLLVAAGWTQWRYKRGHRPRIDVKRAMMRWAMKGRSKAYLTGLAERFADNEVSNGLRPGAIRTLEQHKADGDTLMLASAAVDLLVAPIARRLEIEHFVATDMAWDDQEIVKLEFSSPNCYGAEKLTRVQAHLAENPGLKQNHTIITFYSDSYSDLDLFNFCDVMVAVNPDKRLKNAALGEGFRIEDWDS